MANCARRSNRSCGGKQKIFVGIFLPPFVFAWRSATIRGHILRFSPQYKSFWGCYRRHFFGAAGCYPPHNFRAKALLSVAHFRGFSLLSTAQFSTVCIVIDDTVPRRFPNNCPVCGCYPPHIFPHNGTAQALLSTAQFPVLQGFFRIFSKVIGLLSVTQFAVALAAWPVLLSSALFAAWVVIRGTFSIL